MNAPKTTCFGWFRSYPLQKAIHLDRPDLALLLLQFGADPKLRDSRGRDAFDCVKCLEFRRRMRLQYEDVKIKGIGLNLLV